MRTEFFMIFFVIGNTSGPRVKFVTSWKHPRLKMTSSILHFLVKGRISEV